MPRKIGDIHRQCAYCGKFFLVTPQNRTLCSDKCKEEMRKVRDRMYSFERRKKNFEDKHPDEEYIPNRHRPKTKKEKKPTFSEKLLALKAEGKDYIEEQKKDTIEKYARIIL